MKWTRTWLFQNSRDLTLLWKCSVAIVGGAILLAAVMQGLRPHQGDATIPKLVVTVNGPLRTAGANYKKLVEAREPRPAALAQWIRTLPGVMKANPLLGSLDATELKLGHWEIQPLLEKHLADVEQRELFAQYSRAWLLPAGAARDEAAGRVREMAAQKSNLRFTGEFDGDLLLRDKRNAEALQAFLKEVQAKDAVYARHEAFMLALNLGDKEALRGLCADPRCLGEIHPYWIGDAGRILGDRWLVMRSVVWSEWQHWARSAVAPLALFGAAIWYLILVSSASHERLRWVRYLAPIFAGVLSAWLVIWLQTYLGYNPEYHGRDQSGVQELIYTILYVGLPEEGVKLALFVPFVPLLMKQNLRAKVALTAGCVGLGFAMDENILYFERSGVGVAIVRLMTANFMHIALTGMTGLWFYRMIRSRFHEAAEFVGMFLGMVVAHGMYDFASSRVAQEWGVDLAGIVILAVLAKLYLHQLRPPNASGHRSLISSTSILFLGSALVLAIGIVAAVWEADSFGATADVLKVMLAMVPIGVMFVREFREVS